MLFQVYTYLYTPLYYTIIINTMSSLLHPYTPLIVVLIPSYPYTGRSSGKFVDGTVGRWVKDTIHILDKVVGK